MEDSNFSREDRPLLNELTAIANGDQNFIGTIQFAEVAFTRIPSLAPLSLVHNLVELTLIHTSLRSLKGVENVGHSLMSLTVISGNSENSSGRLTSIEPFLLEMVELRHLNLSENSIKKIENL